MAPYWEKYNAVCASVVSASVINTLWKTRAMYHRPGRTAIQVRARRGGALFFRDSQGNNNGGSATRIRSALLLTYVKAQSVFFVEKIIFCPAHTHANSERVNVWFFSSPNNTKVPPPSTVNCQPVCQRCLKLQLCPVTDSEHNRTCNPWVTAAD